MNHIQLEADGQRWNGSYTVHGDEVCVASAYGGKRARISGEDPEAVALATFEAIVKQRYPQIRRAEFKPGRPYRGSGR
jgi:hypothetical protein